MKTMHKLLALLLAAAMCLTLLAACSSRNDAADETPNADTSDNTTAPAPDADDASDASDEDEEDEIASIVFALPDFMTKAESAGAMEKALNELTEREIGVHVNLDIWDGGNYATEVTLAISGGEQLDLVCLTLIPGSDVSTMHAQGELMDMTPYLNEDYAAEMMDIVRDYVGAYSFSDGIFGVPNFRNYSGSHWLLMRQDVLEDLGLTDAAQNMKTWSDYRDILATVKENTDLYAVAPSSGFTNRMTDYLPTDIEGGCDFSDGYVTDPLNDSNYFLMVDEDGKIQAVDRDPRRVGVYRYNAGLYQDGLLYPDIDTSLAGDDLMKDGVIFSYMVDSDMAVVTQKKMYTNYDLVAVPVSHQLLTTGQINCWGTGIPVTAQEPAAAVRFLNFLYTNADAMNLLVYGIEGQDYEITESGEADYCEGVDAGSCSWAAGNWLFGNTFLLHPWVGNGADFYARSMADLAEAPISPYMGFMPDTTELTNEVAALSSVYNEYAPSLSSGLFTESLYEEFLNALDGAGIDSYIAALQSQLDAWTAQQ